MSPKRVSAVLAVVMIPVCGFMLAPAQGESLDETAWIDVSVELSPKIVPGPLTRCIEFTFVECLGTPPDCDPAVSIVEELITFGDGGDPPGYAEITLKMPTGDWDCLIARDPVHTLRSMSIIEWDGEAYRASFRDDPESGGNWLISGNLDGMEPDDGMWSPRVIDIVELGISNTQFLTYVGGDTDCGYWEENGWHSDVNGDGIVDSLDYSFVSLNWLREDKEADEDHCSPGSLRPVDDGGSNLPIPPDVQTSNDHLNRGQAIGGMLGGEPTVSLELSPAQQTAYVGDYVEIELHAFADGPTAVPVCAINAILSWDQSKLELNSLA